MSRGRAHGRRLICQLVLVLFVLLLFDEIDMLLNHLLDLSHEPGSLIFELLAMSSASPCQHPADENVINQVKPVEFIL